MASINVSLSEARVAQKLEKERRLMENALNEKAEFSRILKVQKEYEAIEAADRGKRAEAQHEFNLDLQAQIQMNAEIRKQMRMDFLTDGENKRAQMEQERMKLEAIKAHKLAQLASVGVPPKDDEWCEFAVQASGGCRSMLAVAGSALLRRRRARASMCLTCTCSPP